MDQDTPEQPGIDVGEYLAVFKRRWLTILIPTVISVALAAALGFLLPPVYEESTMFAVLDLSFEQDTLGHVGRIPDHRGLFSIPGQEIKNPNFLSGLISRVGITEGFDAHDPKERQELWDKILKNLSVEYLESKDAGKPNIVSITYKGRHPGKVVGFVNAIRTQFLDEKNEEFRLKVATVRQEIKTELDREEEGLRANIAEFQALLRSADLEDFGDEAMGRLFDKLGVAQEKLESLQIQLDEREKELERVSTDLLLEHPERSLPKKETNPEWERLKTALELAKKKLSLLKVKFTDLIPAVQDAKRDCAFLQAQLDATTQMITTQVDSVVNKRYGELQAKKDSLQAEVGRLRKQADEQRKRVSALQAKTDRLPDILNQLEEKESNVENSKSRVERVKRAFDAAEFAWDHVVERKQPLTKTLTAPFEEEAYSKDPIFPKMGLFLMLGVVLGALLGIGIAFLSEFRAQAWLSAKQMRRGLPVPLLGEIGVLETMADRRARFRRRVVVGIILFGVAGVVGWIHLCFFDSGMRANLPPWLFDFLKRIYGNA